MIDIFGSIHRQFEFPADIQHTFEFFGDLRQSFEFIDHISVITEHGDSRYRLLYSTKEFGVYNVNITCDIMSVLDQENCVIRIRPFGGVSPVKSSSGLYSISGQGYYSSDSIFFDSNGKTQIDYRLKLSAKLPVPIAAQFMPKPIIRSLTRGITQWRIEEMMKSFMEQSVQAYQYKF